MWIVAFAVILSSMIIFHELGHFLAAKLAGIKVNAFSLGFGKIFAKKIGETEYRIGWLPLGGYIEPDAHSLHNKSVLKRAVMIAAGPFANLVLAVIIMWLLFFVGVPSLLPTVGNVLYNSPAERAGLLPGDKILAINKHQIRVWSEIGKYIGENDEEDIKITIFRDGRVGVVDVKPQSSEIKVFAEYKEKKKYIGIMPKGDQDVVAFSSAESLMKSVEYNYNVIKLNIIGLIQTIKGNIKPTEAVAGPIGIANITRQVYIAGFIQLVYLTAILSVVIGFMNLLPIPILDGGHLVMLLLERCFGVGLVVRITPIANIIGFGALIMLLIFATYADIHRIFLK